MSNRTLLALILSPIACGLIFDIWIVSATSSAEYVAPGAEAIVFFGGTMYGAVFEVLILMPAIFLLHRAKLRSRLFLISCGTALWVLAVLLNLWATSELPLYQAISLLPALSIPGFALVCVYVYLSHNDQAA
jgi:hypothetical protein